MINSTNQENITQQQRKDRQIHPNSQKHNITLKNPKTNQTSQGMEEEKLSYLIPNIINGQMLSKEKGRSTI